MPTTLPWPEPEIDTVANVTHGAAVDAPYGVDLHGTGVTAIHPLHGPASRHRVFVVERGRSRPPTVVKVFPGARGDAVRPREIELYESGLPALLPAACATPRHYATYATADGYAVELECVCDWRMPARWRLDDLIAAAIACGPALGSVSLDDLPAPCREWLTAPTFDPWAELLPVARAALAELRTSALPLEERQWALLEALLDQHASRRSRLARLPLQLAHRDFAISNMTRVAADAGGVTTGRPPAVCLWDWSYCGITSIGDELACALDTFRRLGGACTASRSRRDWDALAAYHRETADRTGVSWADLLEGYTCGLVTRHLISHLVRLSAAHRAACAAAPAAEWAHERDEFLEYLALVEEVEGRGPLPNGGLSC